MGEPGEGDGGDVDFGFFGLDDLFGERELVGREIGLDLIGFGLEIGFEFGQALVEDFDAFVGVADILPFAGNAAGLLYGGGCPR